MTEEQKSLQWLSNILDTLRKECPWDSVQTIKSLRYLTIEEVYELSEAITAGNYDEMRKELGDLFMHLVFYAKIADDEGRFGLSDVLDGICQKLTARHPHIALPDREGNIQAAKQSSTPKWEQVKMKEGRRSALEGVPESLPSLIKAIRIQEKAAGLGFEFPNREMAKAKVDEEYSEFIEALDKYHANGKTAQKDAEEELGDLIFAIIKWARFENLNADDALARTNLKFTQRFKYVESKAHASGRNMQDLNLDEMETYWNEAKTVLCKQQE